MIHCMIVDDEPLAQQVLEQYILQTPGLKLVCKCFQASEAFAALHAHQVDLLFLDIKMPGVSGVDFIRSLKQPPAFIFTTAFSDYALQSYELQGVDYLLKPITYERFKKSIDRYLGQQPVKAPAEEKTYFYIKVDGNLVKLFFKEILYAQSMKDYIRIVTSSSSYLTHLTMTALVALLPERQFSRIHRSYVVNVDQIGIIHRNSVVIGDVQIPIGEHFRAIVQAFTTR